MSRQLRRLVAAAGAVRRLACRYRPISLKARLWVRSLEERLVPTAYTVTNVNNTGAGSLRQAILDANAHAGADTIGFDAAVFGTAQTISLTSALSTISGGLTITGPALLNGQPQLTVQRSPTASGLFRVLDISGVGTFPVNLSNLVITVGNTDLSTSGTTSAGGGIRVADESLTLTNVMVTGNRATQGGGVYIGLGGSLVADGCTFAANTANGSFAPGGGIATVSGSLTLTRCTVTGNTATNGAGLYAGGAVAVNVINSTIAGNSAATYGGGLFTRGTLQVLDSFTLARTSPTGPAGNVPLAAGVSTDAQGRTVVVLTFSGTTLTEQANTAAGANPSLIDGLYTLTVNGGMVTDAAFGWTLDGDNNGTPGGDTTFNLHRLFGDVDGDRDVDADDIFGTPGHAGLVDALFATGPLTPQQAAFDFEGDGDVDADDLFNFFVPRLFSTV